MNSAKIQHPHREFQPIIPPERPWQHIGIGLFVDMPQNEFGYKHVLVAVCYLTKYVVARPLRTKTSAVVAELLSVYLTYGVPKNASTTKEENLPARLVIPITYKSITR